MCICVYVCVCVCMCVCVYVCVCVCVYVYAHFDACMFESLMIVIDLVTLFSNREVKMT